MPRNRRALFMYALTMACLLDGLGLSLLRGGHAAGDTAIHPGEQAGYLVLPRRIYRLRQASQG